MGCKQSKEAHDVLDDTRHNQLKAAAVNKESAPLPPVATNSTTTVESPHVAQSTRSNNTSKISEHSTSSSTNVNSKDRFYKQLSKIQPPAKNDENVREKLVEACHLVTKTQASYLNSNTKSTPLHLAVRAMDVPFYASSLAQVLHNLVQAYPEATTMQDAAGNIPLHYIVAPTAPSNDSLDWKARTRVLQLLLTATPVEVIKAYFGRNNVTFQAVDATGPCTPLYRSIQAFPDDFDIHSCTAEFIKTLLSSRDENNTALINTMVANASDGDQPLALLYRRFTRQFDLAEKFFDGDNSRPEVVEHRRHYKTAAGNTWKLMELLLQPATTAANQQWWLVHRAVQVQTPPDLLRYIVETNAEDLTQKDEYGNLPLHYAAQSQALPGQTFPIFYTKYVVDELLYKFPEAASIADANGKYPLELAVTSGKPWIGGGIQSLYEAYPQALEHINMDEHETLRRVLSMDTATVEHDDDDDAKEEKMDIVYDEQHDAVMLVQRRDVSPGEVVTSMWAHEEDAGVQMLGCVALDRMAAGKNNTDGVMRIALSAVAAVVNAMKAHPNEMIVQEKACSALKSMSIVDGQREVSFVASGAVAAMVGAMQAHVSDAGVQAQACAALARVLTVGGQDRATIIASVSGLTAIINAMAAHPDVCAVQEYGCLALKELTEYTHANLPDLPQASTEPLLLSARDKFPEACEENVNLLLERLVV